MRLNGRLATTIIGVAIAFVQPQITLALSTVEVAKLAKAITVQIQNKTGSGTGVILKKEGKTYTVLTARHVIETQAQYEILTPDGQHYPLNYSTVKKLPDVDLAIVQFTSSQSYAVAKIGNSDEATEGAVVYVAGFPQTTAAISNSSYSFLDGKITSNARQRDGYALVYTNNTLPGMSGGPVLNDKGELVGIHGRADMTENFEISDKNPNIIIKSGFNLGIPIKIFTSSKIGKNLGVTTQNSSLTQVPSTKFTEPSFTAPVTGRPPTINGSGGITGFGCPGRRC
ncbi:serine protease [Nostoc sp. C117]|uniref:S1 family peptidase n=1 Tax=Nostoc sp. C117 TaxID=3349875 RepID=UPI00370DDE85